MDETTELCSRLLGRREGAVQAAEEAHRRVPVSDRLGLLAAAVTACRARESVEVTPPVATVEPRGLTRAVAGELAIANGGLPQRQREALALRELLGLSHEQVALAIGIDPVAVASLLARARLRLRAQLRGGPDANLGCAEREQSLPAIARRQDSAPVGDEETTWLMEHLGHCQACTAAHAAMLEASVCYRAWRVSADDRPGIARGQVSGGG
jgi:hypothetical protein